MHSSSKKKKIVREPVEVIDSSKTRQKVGYEVKISAFEIRCIPRLMLPENKGAS